MLEPVTDELSHKEWIELLDNYLYENKIDVEKWERLNEFQRFAINELKKSKKRHA